MKSKNIFKKLASSLYRKNASLLDALKKITGKSSLEKLLSHNNDWRNLPEEVSYFLNIAPEDILHKVADYFQMPYISRVPSIDVEMLPKNISLSDLRKLACIPRINNGSLTAFICLDPKRARMLFPESRELPMAIASWSSIQSAINESEAILSARNNQIEETKALKSLEAAKQALHLVILQVKNYFSDGLKINFNDENKITYSFITSEKKNAQGNIHNRVRAALLALLSEYATNDHSLLQLSDIAKHQLAVEEEERGSVFNISLSVEQKPLSISNIISFPDSVSSRVSYNTKENDTKKSEIIYNILLVDDNQVFAKVLEKFLSKLNVESTYASNGKEAINLINSKAIKPDIVICDLHMPEMNGCEFVKRIREELNLVDLPIVILTSDDDVETELKLLTDGADAFIAKNEDPRLLCIKIEKLLEKAQRKKAA